MVTMPPLHDYTNAIRMRRVPKETNNNKLRTKKMTSRNNTATLHIGLAHLSLSRLDQMCLDPYNPKPKHGALQKNYA